MTPTPREMAAPSYEETSRRHTLRTSLIRRSRLATTSQDLDSVYADLCDVSLGARSIEAVLSAIAARRVALADPATLIRETFAGATQPERIALLRKHPAILRDAAIDWRARCLAGAAHDADRRSIDGWVAPPNPARFIDTARDDVARWLEAA